MDLLNLLLAVLGSIASLTWLLEQFRRRVQARAFFRLYPLDEEIIVIVPSLGPSGPNVSMTFEDALACATAIDTFVRNRRKYRVRLHTQVTSDDFAGNLFVIGGEAVNHVTERIGREGLLSLRTQHTPRGTAIVHRSGRELVPPRGDSEADAAIVAVIMNPWRAPDSASRIYIAAGLEGIGTWAAAAELTRDVHRFSKKLGAQDISTARPFEIVISVKVNGYQPPTTVVTQATQVG